jgi:PAS domain S-box-containing protein
MDKLRIAKRLWLVLIISSASLFFLGLFSIYQLFLIKNVTNEIRVTLMPGIQFLTMASGELGNHRMKTYKHLTLNDLSLKDAEELEMEKLIESVQDNLNSFEKLVTTAQHIEKLNTIRQHLANYKTVNKKILEFSRQNLYDYAKAIIYSSSFKEYTAIRDSLNSLISFNVAQSQSASQKTAAVFKGAILFIGSALVGLIFVISYFGRVVVKRVFDHLNELALSEAKYRAILESSSDANYFLDKNCRILSFNKAAQQKSERIYNANLKNGDNILNLMPKETRISFLAHFKKALAGEEIVYEHELQLNNEKFWFRRYYYPVRDHSGEIFGVAINSENITQQKQDEYRILSRDRSLSEISFIQSHHVRGPIATLLGLVSIFDPTNPQGDLNTRIIQDVRVTAEKLDKIVHEIVSKTYSQNSNP